MRSVLILVSVAVCAVGAAVTTRAQVPAPSGVQPVPYVVPPVFADEPVADPVQPDSDEPEVFAAVGPERPKPDTPATAPAGMDARFMVENMSNSVLNAGRAFDGSLGRLSTGDAVIDRLIVEAGQKHGVDPTLVYAVMNQESAFKKNAVSHKGASGYMQLMPGTARRFGVTNIFDPRQNIDAGTRYLRFLLDLFDNNIELALAGYNAGEYRVIRDGYRVPQIRETQNYVRSITARYYGRGTRRYFVTFGASRLTEKDRAEVVQAAILSTNDRGTDVLSNYY